MLKALGSLQPKDLIMVPAMRAQTIAIGLGLALGLLFCLSLEAFGAPPAPARLCVDQGLCSFDGQSVPQDNPVLF